MKQFAIMFWCGCYFMAVFSRGWRCSVGWTVYGLPKNVRGVPVIPVCI